MNIYLKLTLVALVAVYVVGLSGFTQSWRGMLAAFLKVDESRLRALPPFDCTKCATFWACLIYAICAGAFGLSSVAFVCLLSFIADPLVRLLSLLKEAVQVGIGKMMMRL